ncbi:MAG: hypothetical protein KKB91_12495 [Proteobacteria bacterium]|jgi:uncharacterized Zn finger protein|nr:hypothetical protein [Desulfocapsa sp.]MBU3943972.1 hypothetical protein [Pseudomonadota bacterium]MCG2742299.1 hypothetical protein [Desulfobacteraceae bacterium]MBU4028265.1 hypothetical protein [Pseudomonadota bacterium]MBU4043004.1 hypothetical protein [Pseudomonadota bacterium]
MRKRKNNRNSDYPEYVPVAEKKAKAAKKLQQLQKTRPGIKPVILEGSALARTWWGKSWNQNLERYADYSNRIGRGRSYVRHGAVLDLQIEAGQVIALIQGSASRPYEVEISIRAMSTSQWTVIKKQCEGRLKSLQELLAGKFPKDLSEIFLAEGRGLFPSPKEIAFACSCPDWASMCKHVAAALYGIGARIDDDPTLFFTLRGVRTDELVTEAVHDKTAELLAKAEARSAKILDEDDLSSLFGIDLDTGAVCDHEKIKVANKKSSSKKTVSHKPPAAVKRPLNRHSQTSLSPLDQIAGLIAGQKDGVTADLLVEKTGLAKTKIYALVHRLKLQGKIKNKAHGIYVTV